VLQDYRGGHKHESFKIESCISSDDNHVITCSEDGYIVDYDLVSGAVHSRTSSVTEHSHNFSNHLSTSLSSLSYHPKLPLLLTASYNGAVRIWDCSGGPKAQ
jgi:WD40 repeat protein